MGRRIFMVGDFESNTGPAIANRALKKALWRRVRCSKGKTRIGRVFELVMGILFSDVVCFCGFSELNVYGIKLAKIFRKKTAYLMHGYIELEAKINHCKMNPKRIKMERYILQGVDIVICVSKLLADEVLKNYPSLKNVQVVYNIVELDRANGDIPKKDSLLIMSTGGGMPRKNNLMVCEAIRKINVDLPQGRRLKYVIAGKGYGHEREFRKYDFVEFVGEIPYNECLNLMKASRLYVQNSSFETFGLAIIEAIECGCGVIVAKNIGANEVVKNLSVDNVLMKCDDVEELSNKISNALKNKATGRLTADKDLVGRKAVASRMMDLLEGVVHD